VHVDVCWIVLAVAHRCTDARAHRSAFCCSNCSAVDVSVGDANRRPDICSYSSSKRFPYGSSHPVAVGFAHFDPHCLTNGHSNNRSLF